MYIYIYTCHTILDYTHSIVLYYDVINGHLCTAARSFRFLAQPLVKILSARGEHASTKRAPWKSAPGIS